MTPSTKRFADARKAIELHLESLAEGDAGVPPIAGMVAQQQANPEFAGWIWAVDQNGIEYFTQTALAELLRENCPV